MLCDGYSTLRRYERGLGKIGRKGLNRRSVSVINIVEGTSIRPGVYSSRVVTEVPLMIGGFNPVITDVNGRDIFLSGGKLKNGDLRIGPLVYSYSAQGGSSLCSGSFTGVNESLIDGVAPLAGTTRQLYFRVTGPGEPQGGGFYEKLDMSYNGLGFFITLRPTGRVVDMTQV